MKYNLLFLIFLNFTFALAQDGELLLTGVFKGESIYIQNPYDADSDRFCIQQIVINGKTRPVNLSLTAVRLNFDQFDLYTPVTIQIHYGDSCKPKIVNPEAVLYHSSFKYDSLVLNDSIMHWYTKGDRRDGRYEIEQLKGDMWDLVKTMRSKGRFDGAQYVYFPTHRDGGNKYRIKYVLPRGRYLYSAEMEYYHYPEGVSFSPRVVTDKMNLSREASFQILKDGEVILKGKGKVIPLRKLAPGDYSIILDGDEDTFVKK
jgi:hypothetical protein